MDKEQSVHTIKEFKKITIITFFLSLIVIVLSMLFKNNFVNFNYYSLFIVMVKVLALAFIIGYIFSLIYLYKTTKILKLAGKINIKPYLILLITLIASLILFLIPIIVFIIIWQKANNYIEGG
jgi:hypothetical protein